MLITSMITSTILESQSLELATIVIAINVLIGGFSGEDFWLDYRCLITGNCPITLPDYNIAD